LFAFAEAGGYLEVFIVLEAGLYVADVDHEGFGVVNKYYLADVVGGGKVGVFVFQAVGPVARGYGVYGYGEDVAEAVGLYFYRGRHAGLEGELSFWHSGGEVGIAGGEYGDVDGIVGYLVGAGG